MVVQALILLGLVTTVIVYPKMRPGYRAEEVWKIPQLQRIFIFSAIVWFAHLGWNEIRHCSAYLHPIAHTQIGRQSFLVVVGSILIPLTMYLIAAFAAIKTVPRKITGTAAQHQKRWQLWTDTTYCWFMSAFALGIIAIMFVPGGIGSWVGNYLISAARDANLDVQYFCVEIIGIFSSPTGGYTEFFPPASQDFVLGVQSALSAILMYFFWPQATRIAGFLTAFCKQLKGLVITDSMDAFVRTLRAPRTYLKVRHAHPLLKNIAATFWWLVTCYLILFWLIGFSGGPLGETIENWLKFSMIDANFPIWPTNFDDTRLRIFFASIIALYGAVPLAVSGCSFLPYFKRQQIILTPEGATFPDGPFLQLGFRPMRLWTDFASIDVIKKSKLVIKFHTGGKLELKVSQLDRLSLDKFLGAIDEHATNCVVSDTTVCLRSDIRSQLAIEGKQGELGVQSAQSFQSTIFVPHDQGSWLPNGESRVVRLLASRPLSCVYLVRMNSGELAIAKQFFLADDNEQRAALQKTFEREYELLRKIDHQRVSKVLDVFHREESTYLLIEHASGVDLRKLIEEDGAVSETTAIDWALEICDIMTALHGHSPPIVHRDLTPDNLILDEEGHVRIIDFGAAHQFMEGITGTIIGKQCYVSPEQLRGQAGPRSDIYSFGCTLHYLLTGKEPVALTQCDPRKMRNVVAGLNDLVMACTQFEEEERPESFAQVKDKLISIKEEKATEADRVLQKLNLTLLEAANQENQVDAQQASQVEEPIVIKVPEKEKIEKWS